MKEEKEEIRQVRTARATLHIVTSDWGTTTKPYLADTNYEAPREESRKGGEGTIRKDGREDAQEEGRKAEAEGEAQQTDQLMIPLMRLHTDG